MEILNTLWRMIKRVTLLVSVFLTFLIFLELFRVFVFFYRLNPILAVIYVLVLLCFALWLVHGILRQWFMQPRALKPPPMPESLISADTKLLTKYARYLERYLERLTENPQLDEKHAHLAEEGLSTLRDTLRSRPSREDLVKGIESIEQGTIVPVLQRLEEDASAEIRKSVRDVMLGVTLSPYHSIDVFVVLYRNASMVLRISSIFATRPLPRDQLLLLRDTFRVVATVNLLNVSKTLLESLFTKLPLMGKVLDDIGQGLGAGLFTSAAGHAAVERCAAFRRWDKNSAAISLAEQAGTFFGDVRNLFTRDVLPAMKGRIRSSTPTEVLEEPHFWDRVTQGITASVDTTARTLNTLFVQPAVTGGKGVVAAGGHVSRHVATGGRHTYRGIGRIARTFGQRIKYTFRSRRFRE